MNSTKNGLKVRHPRLEAYYNCRALNIASIGVALSVLFLARFGEVLFTGIAIAMFLGFIVGYTVWFWTGKRKEVEQSQWLSNVSGLYIVYFLICVNLVENSIWWLVFAFVAAIAILFIDLCRGADSPDLDNTQSAAERN